MKAFCIGFPQGDDQAIFVEHPAQGVHKLCALMDKAPASAEENGSRLLLRSLRFNEPHFGRLYSDYNRLGIGRIILPSFDKV